jgi:hypothetical protein
MLNRMKPIIYILGCALTIWGSVSVAKPLQMISISAGEHDLISIVQSVAVANRIPLGIINSKGMCGIDIVVRKRETITLNQFIVQVNNQISPFMLTMHDGVLLLGPKTLNGATKELLDTNIPYFRPEDTTMSGLGQYLWMYIRAAVNPKQTSTLSVITNPNSHVIKDFKVNSTTTVLDLLNAIVRQDAKGMWVLSEVSGAWKREMNGNHINIRGYDEPVYGEAITGCQK